MAGAMGLQHSDAFTLLQQMRGSRQTGYSGADHAHIHLDRALERGSVGTAWGEVFP